MNIESIKSAKTRAQLTASAQAAAPTLEIIVRDAHTVGRKVRLLGIFKSTNPLNRVTLIDLVADTVWELAGRVALSMPRALVVAEQVYSALDAEDEEIEAAEAIAPNSRFAHLVPSLLSMHDAATARNVAAILELESAFARTDGAERAQADVREALYAMDEESGERNHVGMENYSLAALYATERENFGINDALERAYEKWAQLVGGEHDAVALA